MNVRVTVLCGLALLMGCQPEFESVTFDPLSTPPVPTVVRSYEIEVPVGIAVAVEARPRSSNATDYDSSDSFALISEDKSVLEVKPTPRRDEWVFVGVAAGSTCVQVRINGDTEDCIPATVTPVD